MVLLSQIFLAEFRTKFKYPNKKLLHWFPGHMGKGIKDIQRKLKDVDCIFEIHDARIPISGRNQNFKNIIGDLKPHILILNKMDLADLSNKEHILKMLKREGIYNVLFTNCKNDQSSGVSELIPFAVDIISKSDRYQRSENKEHLIMITGVPNVGKSTIINALRNKFLRRAKAAAVGAIAGITRSIGTRIKVSEAPLMYVLDTPGILEPSVSDMDAALKLALCSSMQDHLVGSENIADYLLFWLNNNQRFEYVDYMEVKEPTDNIVELLMLTAVSKNRFIKRRNLEGGYALIPNTEYAANYFIRGFRTGLLGQVMLDNEFL